MVISSAIPLSHRKVERACSQGRQTDQATLGRSERNAGKYDCDYDYERLRGELRLHIRFTFRLSSPYVAHGE